VIAVLLDVLVAIELYAVISSDSLSRWPPLIFFASAPGLYLAFNFDRFWDPPSAFLPLRNAGNRGQRASG
jgi:hypothetical protein